jgi:general secretion pathway protein D
LTVRWIGPGQVLAMAQALALLLVLALFMAPIARAQSGDLRPPATPAVLTAIEPVAQSAQAAQFTLHLAPAANGFAGITDPAHAHDDVAVALALTTGASSARLAVPLTGLVRAVRFEQADSVLIVHFTTAAPALAETRLIAPDTLSITVRTQPTPATPAHALPAVADTPDWPGELVMLKYADVGEVVGLISPGAAVRPNDHFTPREPGFGSTSLTGGSYQPTPVNPETAEQPLGEAVDAGGTIAVDRRLNAIWLRGPPDKVARWKAAIAAIDVPVDTVVLETELVELSETGAHAIGIDLTNANGQIAVFSVQTGQFVPSGLATNGNGRLASAQVQAAISAQVSKGNGKIVSRPRISALSGATAKIITGDALPILTAITLSGVNGVSQQVQYVNVGVTLQIAPRVAGDGMVTSHVFCVVSSVTGTSQGYPTISQREAETVASVRDGDSFVIGGLTQDSTLDNRSKVPLLGDIPLIGGVFGLRSHTHQKTDLYIVVTPHVVRANRAN